MLAVVISGKRMITRLQLGKLHETGYRSIHSATDYGLYGSIRTSDASTTEAAKQVCVGVNVSVYVSECVCVYVSECVCICE